jgi:D-amino-acid dehydrogenase
MSTVAIIGAGISGLMSAYYLSKEGYDVTVYDQSDASNGCSYGNAGMIVPSHIIPLASPGMISKGIKMLLNSQSPFYIKPRASLDLLRWGYLFYKKSTPEHVQRSIEPLRDISLLSKKLFAELSGELDFGWKENGLFMLYKTFAVEKEESEMTALANRSGIEAYILSPGEVQDMEPNIKVKVKGAVYYPGDAQIDPGKLMNQLLEYLRKKGVKIKSETEVIDFLKTGNQIKGIVTLSGAFDYDKVVLAGGVWSGKLMKLLNIQLPLQAGKGYSLMNPEMNEKIKIPAIMVEARATATPIGNGVRFAGTMEISDINYQVNRKRIMGILNSVTNYYPDIQMKLPDKTNIWKGHRPCSPDGLPYIGKIGDLVIATGHGMMGVSLGPATGKLVKELVCNDSTSMDISCFRPDRFN